MNGKRNVTGVLRGFDPFMNITLDQAVEEATKNNLGIIVIRGNSIELIECLEPIDFSKK
jgi:small nuclear ribonucleoprotein G